jgi:GNAT superfamily N-acetyltransferase
VNAAYAIESGCEGVSFKKGLRLSDPYERNFVKAYEDGRIIKVSRHQEIVGITYWEMKSQCTLYFGPFAVRPDCQGKGIGRIMLEEIERLTSLHSATAIDISVVNHRSDLLPWYTSLGKDKPISKCF